MIEKELSSIAWNVTEEQYRADPALSYSTIAKYEREGFDKLDKLFEHISTPSLTMGSMVDSLITGSQEEFNSRFFVANAPSIGEKEQLITDYLFHDWHECSQSFSDIPDDVILGAANQYSFQKNWRDDTRVRVLKERCGNYYSLKFNAEGKVIVNLDTYYKVMAMVRALKESTATHAYFAENDELSPIRRYYQLKFKARLQGVDYRCMADLLIVNYEKKQIIPCDLKTSGHPEWQFPHSFLQWSYAIQARLYWLVIKTNLANNGCFKDFELKDYRFIVVNKDSLKPLVWEFPLTQAAGDLVDDTGTVYRDPLTIGKELRGYLDNRPPVPDGIDMNGLNIINCLHKVKDES